jgi:hypothetical protein
MPYLRHLTINPGGHGIYKELATLLAAVRVDGLPALRFLHIGAPFHPMYSPNAPLANLHTLILRSWQREPTTAAHAMSTMLLACKATLTRLWICLLDKDDIAAFKAILPQLSNLTSLTLRGAIEATTADLAEILTIAPSSLRRITLFRFGDDGVARYCTDRSEGQKPMRLARMKRLLLKDGHTV